MANRILVFFFKILRRLRRTFNKFVLQNRITSYYYLSNKRFKIDKGFTAGPQFSIHTDLSETAVCIGKHVTARENFRIRMGNSGQLIIRENCFFNNNCSINCLGTIEIGNNNQFGEGVLFYDHNHRYANKSELISGQGYNVGTIRIGNNCWIGSNVVILKDVSIGDNVVIGAGCVIYKSISCESIVVNHQNLTITTRL